MRFLFGVYDMNEVRASMVYLIDTWTKEVGVWTYMCTSGMMEV